MNIEKVKEIKEKLKERYYYLDQAYSDHLAYGGKADEQQEEEIYFLGDIRTLINELEESNKKWQRKAVNYYQKAKSYGVECIIDDDIDETLFEGDYRK